jgi:hypothetical protein
MMKKTMMMTAGAALALLAGCGGGGEAEKAKTGPQSAEEVAKEMSQMQLRPGQWETTTQILSMEAPGVPAEATKAVTDEKTTVATCITPEQAAKPDASFLSGQQGANCSYSDFDMSGGKVRGRISCQNKDAPGSMTMAMSGTYAEEEYDFGMDMELRGDAPGQSMTMKARTSGRRVGECPAGGATPAP